MRQKSTSKFHNQDAKKVWRNYVLRLKCWSTVFLILHQTPFSGAFVMVLQLSKKAFVYVVKVDCKNSSVSFASETCFARRLTHSMFFFSISLFQFDSEVYWHRVRKIFCALLDWENKTTENECGFGIWLHGSAEETGTQAIRCGWTEKSRRNLRNCAQVDNKQTGEKNWRNFDAVESLRFKIVHIFNV